MSPAEFQLIGSQMLRLLSLLVLAALALHGYFYVQYKTFDACEVSAIRLKADVFGTLPLPADLLGTDVNGDVIKAIADRIRTRSGYGECYRGALFAPDAKAIGVSLP